MSDIIVYEAERKLGLEDAIKSQSSIAFEMPVYFHDNHIPNTSLTSVATLSELMSEAGLNDPDIYNVFSILVSTVWNSNDDVFTPEEVWAARETPRFKPTNLGHDEKQMVGGIINSWAVDENLNLVNDTTAVENLPDIYHLLVASVIYRQWQDPDLKSRAENLIQEIEAGEKYVSMECVFRNFDYGVVTPNGENRVIARNEQTAFLTRHLRAYGGTGYYQDHKLGRVLKNITFSGKGFVDRPANPDSIIFDKDHIFSFANAKNDKSFSLGENGVINSESEFLNEEKDDMTDVLTKQVEELKEALSAAQAENTELADKLAEANVAKYQTQIKELEDAIATLQESFSILESERDSANVKVEELTKDLEEKISALADMTAEANKAKEEAKKKGRKDKMCKAGFSEDEIEAKYDTFASLSDEQFDLMINTLVERTPVEAEEETEAEAEEETEDEDEVTEASEVVESEDDDSTHSVASDDESELDTARAGLQQWVEECVMK